MRKIEDEKEIDRQRKIEIAGERGMAIDDERERIPVMILLICWSAELGQKVNLGFSANTSTSP
jgi:hypothetical protein